MGEQGPQQSSHDTIIRGGDGSIDHRQRHLQILPSTHKLSLSRNKTTQLKVTHKQVMVQKFHELLQISAKVNFRDKNFVITLNFRDSMLAHPFFLRVHYIGQLVTHFQI